MTVVPWYAFEILIVVLHDFILVWSAVCVHFKIGIYIHPSEVVSSPRIGWHLGEEKEPRAERSGVQEINTEA